jgi:NADPH2:quinone reductase
MKALLSKRPGPPETLELTEVADPAAAPGELLVAIKAAGVNFPDALIIEDRYQLKPARPFAPGAEVAGVVESVGAGVVRFAPGDRVLGSAGCGGYAERIALREEQCLRIPDAMPFEEAAAFMLTYGTSYYALKNRGRLEAGETLLVLGAAGGVGVAAVQLGKALGARVIGAVSSADKAAFAKRCGADETLVYPSGALSKDQSRALASDFKRVCAGGADVIFDAVGGDYCDPALRTMNYEGRYLVIGFPAGIPAPPLNLALLKNCSIVGVFWGAFVAREPDQHGKNMHELFELYVQGRIRPHISQTFSLADGAKAIRALLERRATGKLVIVI